MGAFERVRPGSFHRGYFRLRPTVCFDGWSGSLVAARTTAPHPRNRRQPWLRLSEAEVVAEVEQRDRKPHHPLGLRAALSTQDLERDAADCVAVFAAVCRLHNDRTIVSPGNLLSATEKAEAFNKARNTQSRSGDIHE